MSYYASSSFYTECFTEHRPIHVSIKRPYQYKNNIGNLVTVKEHIYWGAQRKDNKVFNA